MRVWPGDPYPLGAKFDGSGTNFSVFSEIAEKVELCLFNENGEETRTELPEVTGYCWHGYFPEVLPGQRYGFRVHGPWNPGEGQRCCASKLLLDPYSMAIHGRVQWNETLFTYRFGDPNGASGPLNDADSAPYMPKSVVVSPFFDWDADHLLHIPMNESIIYETHVRGFSMRHPDIPAEIRGTYAALGHPVAIKHFKYLGITAVELQPVHHFVHDSHLLDKGLCNYWGYNSIGYFAPHDEYGATKQVGRHVQEFKQMVKTLHEEGIEVILDVVYNHTAEGNHLGPVLSFKGIDNAAYYRLVQKDRQYYMDYTGTGNSLNMRHPHVLQLIMDSLRYWVNDMHVDGFRFDLAATLARELHDVDRLSAFFDLIQQDPVVSQVKLIAEPWDVGEGGYQVGNFPPAWSEWNGKYRDTVRDYWRGADETLGSFAYRLTGSPDLYEMTGRRPYASVNFVTAHDGFTLQDLVSYNEKHNDANGEENRDGENHNRSWNCGAEGPTENPEVNKLRERQKRNFLTTLILSQGMPMLLGGDEMGRTQQGNNNAYCQDNEISWYDWQSKDQDLIDFVSELINIRKEHPVFHRRRWYHGRPIRGMADIAWLKPNAQPMKEQDWQTTIAKSLSVYLNGDALNTYDDRGELLVDDSFLLFFNHHHEPLNFTFPAETFGKRWHRVVDTSKPLEELEKREYKPAQKVRVEGRSIAVFCCRIQRRS